MNCSTWGSRTFSRGSQVTELWRSMQIPERCIYIYIHIEETRCNCTTCLFWRDGQCMIITVTGWVALWGWILILSVNEFANLQDLYNRRCKTPPLQGRVLARRATGKLTDKCGAFWHRISESRCYGGIASSILPDFGRCTPSCQQTSRSVDTVVICAATNPLGKILASISHHCNKTSPINKPKTMAAEVDPGSCVCRAFFFPLSLSLNVFFVASFHVAKHSWEALSEASKQLDLVDQRGSAAGEPWSHLVTLYWSAPLQAGCEEMVQRMRRPTGMPVCCGIYRQEVLSVAHFSRPRYWLRLPTMLAVRVRFIYVQTIQLRFLVVPLLCLAGCGRHPKPWTSWRMSWTRTVSERLDVWTHQEAENKLPTQTFKRKRGKRKDSDVLYFLHSLHSFRWGLSPLVIVIWLCNPGVLFGHQILASWPINMCLCWRRASFRPRKRTCWSWNQATKWSFRIPNPFNCGLGITEMHLSLWDRCNFGSADLFFLWMRLRVG